MDGTIFERTEMKYIITPAQREALLEEVMPYLTPDPHGESTIFSLYLDSEDYRIIRTSLLGGAYKEKLRVRSYGPPKPDGDVFVELKKKYKGRVYKRRVKMSGREALEYLAKGTHPLGPKNFGDRQILSELDYAFEFYGYPKPKALLKYERSAYFVKDGKGGLDPALRLTFDSHIRYTRDFGLFNQVSEGVAGARETEILQDRVLMEFKTDIRTPLWFLHAMQDAGIVQGSFSKYGTAYQNLISPELFPNNREDMNLYA